MGRVVVKSFLNEIDTGNSSTNKTINDNEAEMVLDEYGDLNSLLVHGENELQDGSGFRIVLERYSIALVRDHIVRLRSLLGGNSPNSVSLDEGGDGGADGIESSPSNEKETKRRDEGQIDGNVKSSEEKGEGGSVSNNAEEKRIVAKQKQEKEIKIPPKDMPFFSLGKPLSPDIYDLKKFFYYACGENPSLYLDDSSDISTTRENVTSK